MEEADIATVSLLSTQYQRMQSKLNLELKR